MTSTTTSISAGISVTSVSSESGLLSDLYPSKGVNSFGLNAQTTQAFFNKTSDGTYDVPFAVENITQNSDGTWTSSGGTIYYLGADGVMRASGAGDLFAYNPVW